MTFLQVRHSVSSTNDDGTPTGEYTSHSVYYNMSNLQGQYDVEYPDSYTLIGHYQSPPVHLPTRCPVRNVPSCYKCIVPSLIDLIFPSSLPPIIFVKTAAVPYLSELQIEFPAKPVKSDPVRILTQLTVRSVSRPRESILYKTVSQVRTNLPTNVPEEPTDHSAITRDSRCSVRATTDSPVLSLLILQCIATIVNGVKSSHIGCTVKGPDTTTVTLTSFSLGAVGPFYDLLDFS